MSAYKEILDIANGPTTFNVWPKPSWEGKYTETDNGDGTVSLELRGFSIIRKDGKMEDIETLRREMLYAVMCEFLLPSMTRNYPKSGG